jgi:hypothetical protein
MRIILLLDVTQCSLVEIYKYFGECSAEMLADLCYDTRDRCVEDACQYIVSAYPSKHATRTTLTSEKLPQATGVEQLKLNQRDFAFRIEDSLVCRQLYIK